MIFARAFTLAATVAATAMGTVAACRPITFTIYRDAVVGLTRSSLEINGLYSGSTGWYKAYSDASCSKDNRYCYSFKQIVDGSRELRVTLLIGGIEYKFEKANRKPGIDVYEYWHCVDA
ncbi:hypothetical protein BGZ81_003992 [Podila clonocystis]|nr:hypothetical protein BGZ81_003992 [Podila clonocystis]